MRSTEHLAAAGERGRLEEKRRLCVLHPYASFAHLLKTT